MRRSRTHAAAGAQVAAELSGEAQIATVLPVSTPVHGPANKPSEQQPARAGPGHVYLCGQALLLGAMQATGKASQQLFSSEADLARVWEDEFVRCSQVKESRRAACMRAKRPSRRRAPRACSHRRGARVLRQKSLPSACTRGGMCRGGVLTPAPRAPPQAAADSMTPVAGYYIREHVLRQPEETREDQAVHDWEAPWVSDYY